MESDGASSLISSALRNEGNSPVASRTRRGAGTPTRAVTLVSGPASGGPGGSGRVEGGGLIP